MLIRYDRETFDLGNVFSFHPLECEFNEYPFKIKFFLPNGDCYTMGFLDLEKRQKSIDKIIQTYNCGQKFLDLDEIEIT